MKLTSLTVLLLLCGCQGDRHVALTNTVVDQHGVMVTDGFSTEMGGPFGSYTFLGTMINVGARQGQGEASAFGGRHAPTLRSVDWATAPNIVEVAVAPKVPIALSVWIVKGPFAQQKQKALNDVAQTESTYASERLGVFFNIVEVLDVTANSKAASYFNFDCSQMGAMQKDLLGPHAQRINVYYVDQVNVNGTYATTNGNACSIGGSFVAMGSASGGTLLSHEIGHALALTHTDELSASLKSAFDITNVMWSFSSNRGYLTEGQTLRAHLSKASFLNISPGKPRLGEPVRDCGAEVASRACPSIKKRLWADGAFPVN
jgi:hypothetical protein